jgi:hypothetical protein
MPAKDNQPHTPYETPQDMPEEGQQNTTNAYTLLLNDGQLLRQAIQYALEDAKAQRQVIEDGKQPPQVEDLE